MNVKKMTYTGMLTALAIVIPVYMGFLSVTIPPAFTATITAHVPMFLSMFLGPAAAIFVGLGSAFGFLITKGPVIAARALSHAIVGGTGAYLLKKGVSMEKIIVITAPLHGLIEGLFILPFGIAVFKSAYYVVITVGIGTMIHHSIDGIIALVLIKSLSKALKKDFSSII